MKKIGEMDNRVRKWIIVAKVTLGVLILLFVIFSLIFSSGLLQAAEPDWWSILAGAGAGPTTFSAWASNLLNLVTGLIAILAVVMVIIGGIVYATSQGNPNQMGVAKEIIVSAIAGVALFALANWLLGDSGIISRFFPEGG